MPIILTPSRRERTPWHGQLQVLLELSITVENKGELINCLTNMIVESPDRTSWRLLPTVDTVRCTGSMAVMAVRTLEVKADANLWKRKTD